MPDDPDSSLAGLTFTDNIGIDWKPVDTPPDDAHLAIANETNESFLKAVSAIATFAGDGSLSGDASEDDNAMSQEIARLDLKINLLLELVSQLIYTQLEIPDKRRVTVSSSDVSWDDSGQLPTPGSTVFVQLYIQHGTPKPLCFYGEVISSQDEYDTGCARVCYLGLSGSAQSWLDKLIFRHHRREVAFRRSKTSTD
ncbi:MAG: hypothetical protein ACI9JM_001156 [Halioglobus sp.]|jgi:hypothetical protein